MAEGLRKENASLRYPGRTQTVRVGTLCVVHDDQGVGGEASYVLP